MVLDVSYNKLVKIDGYIWKISKLQELFMTHNNIICISGLDEE